MRNKAIICICCLLFVIGVSLKTEPANAREALKMIIMASQNPRFESPKYAVLAEYLKANIDGIENIELETAKDYPTAAKLFQSGKVDGMFSGSFVAAVLIKKGVAVPVVRPVSRDGISTYRALIVAPEGTPAFRDISEFKGKTVAYCPLASAGEVFARALTKGDDPSDYFIPKLSKSHGVAIRSVMAGDSDYAIVKNLVYNSSDYPGTLMIGGDPSENPNDTLILSLGAYAKYGAAIADVLINLQGDSSDAASKVKDAFNISGFIATTEDDFVHTYENMKRARIDPAVFNFIFE